MHEEPGRFRGDDDDFAGLVLRYLDGLTTEDERRSLTEELKHPERTHRRDLFVALCRQRGILAEALGAQRVSDGFQERGGSAPIRRLRSPRLSRSGSGSSARAAVIAGAVAAGFLVVLILGALVPNRPPRRAVAPTPEPQARAPEVPVKAPTPVIRKEERTPIPPPPLPGRTPPAPPKVSAPPLPPEAPAAKKTPPPPTPEPSPAPAPRPRPAARPTTTSVTVARVDRVAGIVRAIEGTADAPLKKGSDVLEGRGIRTQGTDAAVSLVYSDGSRLDVGGDTVLSRLSVAKGKAISLASGTLTVEASKQPRDLPMILATPHAQVRVLGTRFVLSVTPSSTRLDVSEGRVRLTRKPDGASVEVESGHFTVAAPGAPLRVSAQPGSKPPILLVVGNTALNAGDRAVKARLERLGHSVVVKGDTALDAADASGMALAILSSTSGSEAIGRAFRGAPVPVMTWEAWLYDDLGMTGPRRLKDYGNLPGEHSEIVILSPTHPMAAGRSMKVAVSPPSLLMWGRPNANAIVIAVLAKDVNKAAFFAYERGVRMPGGLNAPARRIGFFLPDATPDILTEDGWAFFDAAVAWGAGRRPR